MARQAVEEQPLHTVKVQVHDGLYQRLQDLNPIFGDTIEAKALMILTMWMGDAMRDSGEALFSHTRLSDGRPNRRNH